ncbi:EscS/YscS/HrcS family type III secretion system export apparatus protein [Halomonas cupida]|uniref:Type III secretion protein n=1 Tax=Halomonas cupida TaxID=44933 RepID=A0A1M7E9F6_9GAMM|nr:flagellar biosynthetic protein FliQ [Halomonas cupida]GEN22782.1 type III secretion protein [Halomonas cupida]SHL88286.1 type III secretion protein S [Halomonas cupida]
MSEDIFQSLMTDALWTVLLLSAPALLTAILIGFGIGLLQALTQIQDQSLPQAVKVITIMLVLIFAGPLLVGQLLGLTNQILDNFAAWSR